MDKNGQNVESADRHAAFKHGRSAYHQFKCRCVVCCRAEAEYRKEYKKRRFASKDFPHGQIGYRYGCRCDVCRGAQSLNGKDYRHRKPRKPFAGDLSKMQFNHGVHGWQYYGCRCAVCRKGREDCIERFKAKKTFRHGNSGYTFHKCRCDVCKQGAKEYRQKFEKMPFEHGLSGYKHHKCRCDVCRAAYRDARKNYVPPNKEKYAETRRRWQNNKSKTDTAYRILKTLRARIWAELMGKKKCAKTMEIVGCSVEDLKRHLESQFQEGMSWENYGKKGWHIDHIRPCCSFDLSSPEQQKACFNWENLQPLWAHDNMVKSDKWSDGLMKGVA